MDLNHGNTTTETQKGTEGTELRSKILVDLMKNHGSTTAETQKGTEKAEVGL